MEKNEKEKVNKTLAKQKFLVIAHSFGTGPPQELVKFLRSRTAVVAYIDHPFFYSKDTRSSITIYEDGQEKEKRFIFSMKGPEVFYYFKDIIFTLYFLAGRRTSKCFDICVACDPLNAFSALILRKIGRVKRVIYSAVDFTPQRFDNWFLNKTYHLINRVCCYHSDEIWNSAKAMIDGRERTTGIKRFKSASQIVVPDGNNFDDIQRYPIEHINRHNLVFMGHLRKKQGIPLIIEALPEIIKQAPRAKLVIIGTGPLEDELKSQAQKLGLEDKVVFRGFIESHADLEKILAQCAVAIAPYVPDKDSFSYYSDVGKPKAYMACGLPVIITPVPAIAFEIADKKAGILIEHNKNELIGAAVKLLKEDDLYQEYRNNAIALAEKYKWDNVFYRGFSQSFKILGIDLEREKKTRVLITVSGLLPPATEMAGLRIIYELAKEINRHDKIDIYILTSIFRFGDKNYLDWIDEQREKEGINIFVINDKIYKNTIFEFLKSKLWFLNKAYQLNKKYNFDIIHDYSSAPLIFLFSFFYKKLMGKTVFHTLCTSNEGWLASYQFNWGIRYIDKVICSGQHLAGKLEKAVAKKYHKRIVYIPLGVDSHRFKQETNKGGLRGRLGLADHHQVVLFIGPLEERKGAFILAQAGKEVLAKTDNVRFIFATYGQGGIDRRHQENKQRLLEIVREHEEKVFLLEGIQSIPSLLALADVFVLPATASHGTLAQPLTLLEAMTAGKPIIASAIDGVTELIKDNDSGLLFEKDNYYQLAEKIIFLAANKEKARALGQRVRQVAMAYDISLTSQKINNLYEKALGKS